LQNFGFADTSYETHREEKAKKKITKSRKDENTKKTG